MNNVQFVDLDLTNQLLRSHALMDNKPRFSFYCKELDLTLIVDMSNYAQISVASCFGEDTKEHKTYMDLAMARQVPNA